jgi:hypothetical protein
MWKVDEKYDVTAEIEIGNMNDREDMELPCQRQTHPACRRLVVVTQFLERHMRDLCGLSSELAALSFCP